MANVPINDGIQTFAQQPPPPPYSAVYVNKPEVIHPNSTPTYIAPAPYPQPIPVVPQFLGRDPRSIQCPRCLQNIVTVVEYESGLGTWLIALAICFFGGICGCCFIPFCVRECQDTIHTCPACRSFISRQALL